MTGGSKTSTLGSPHLTPYTGLALPVAKHICTPQYADLWDDMSPQASVMDVHNLYEAWRYGYCGLTDARQPTYVCPPPPPAHRRNLFSSPHPYVVHL